MRLKTYRAASMAEALTAVKKDLGKDAVILHTRAVGVGGILGFRKKTMVEVTAADEPVAASGRRAKEKPRAEAAPTRDASVAILRATAARNAYRKAAESARVEASPRSQIEAKVEDRFDAGRMNDRHGRMETSAQMPGFAPPPQFARSAPPAQPAPVPAAPMVMTVRERRNVEAEAPKPAPAAAPAMRSLEQRPAAAPQTNEGSDVYRELADIKLLVNQVLHSSPSTSAGLAAGAMPDALFKHYLRLLESSVSRDIADGIIGAVRDELTPAEMLDEAIVRTTVLRHLACLIPVADTVSRPRGNGMPLVIALVGPTGVGKTTTIAKLAAAYKLRHGKSVALVTSDTYRIAAVDQLRTYAGIIGLPLKVVMTPPEMGAAVESLRGYDVVLIDTAGRSQFNADRIAELREFIDAAGPSEIHLVLSSTVGEAVLTKTAEAFAGLRPNRVILTKLDEAVNFGVIVNVAKRLRTALSYVTTGQEVPDDLEPSQPDRLARMVLDNTLSAPQAVSRQRRADSGEVAMDRDGLLTGVSVVGSGMSNGWGGSGGAR